MSVWPLYFLFFLLLNRRPPTSTLFPYTTLSDLPSASYIEDLVVGDVQLLAILPGGQTLDRKSTRLNSSHLGISYAVFCLKNKIIPAQLTESRSLTINESQPQCTSEGITQRALPH